MPGGSRSLSLGKRQSFAPPPSPTCPGSRSGRRAPFEAPWRRDGGRFSHTSRAGLATARPEPSQLLPGAGQGWNPAVAGAGPDPSPHEPAQAEGGMGGWASPSLVLLEWSPKGRQAGDIPCPEPHMQSHTCSALHVTVTQAAPPGPSPGSSDKGSDSFWPPPHRPHPLPAPRPGSVARLRGSPKPAPWATHAGLGASPCSLPHLCPDGSPVQRGRRCRPQDELSYLLVGVFLGVGAVAVVRVLLGAR